MQWIKYIGIPAALLAVGTLWAALDFPTRNDIRELRHEVRELRSFDRQVMQTILENRIDVLRLRGGSKDEIRRLENHLDRLLTKQIDRFGDGQPLRERK